MPGYRLIEATVEIRGPLSGAQMAAIEMRLRRRVTGSPTRTPTFLIDLSDADGTPLDPLTDERALAVLSYLRDASLPHMLSTETQWTAR